MPYANIPDSLIPKMDQCVEDLKSQGHDEESAISICYATLVESRAPDRHVLEAKIRPGDPEPMTGREWSVTIIGPESPADLIEYQGREYIRSKNDRWYDTGALRESISDWEGIKVYDNHLTDKEFEDRGGMRSVKTEWIGSILRPQWNAKERSITATLRLVDDQTAQKLKAAWEAEVLSTVGLSIDTVPQAREILFEGRRIPVIEGFKEILSVDLVTEPAAGGKFRRILASKEVKKLMPFTEEQRKELTAMIGTAVAEALSDRKPEQEIDPEEAAMEVADAAAEVADTAPADADPAAVAQAAADAAQAAADQIAEEEEESMPEAIRRLESRLVLRDRLAEANLPQELKALIQTAYDGRISTRKEIDTMIQRAKEAQVRLDPTGKVTGAGSNRLQVGMSPRDKVETEMLRLFMGNNRFRALESNSKDYVQERISESYKAYIRAGRTPAGYRRVSELIYDLLGGDPFSDQRAYESLTTSNMSSIVKNALNVMLANNYSMRSEWWQPIVTEEEVDTIDQATLVRVYGMSTLSVVDEGTPYTELNWRDDEETPTFVKKGNYVGVTLETLLRDKLNVIRQIPDRLATSWYNTLSSLVAGVFTVNSNAGPVLADTGALFNATAVTTAGGHANLLTTGLGTTAYGAARTALMKQTDQYSGGFAAEQGTRLMMKPRFVLVPADLEAAAIQIRNAELLPGGTNNDVNPYYQEFDVVTVPEWTDANDWALVADPARYPAIWLIFLRGRRVPELFTADSETAGAMFTNDTLRFKVRLLTWRFSSSYECAPVSDWRPLHKSNV